MGATRRGGREGTDRWFLSQHCLPTQQERDSQREGCGTRSPCCDIRTAAWPLEPGHGWRATTEARNGRWHDRDPQGAVCGRRPGIYSWRGSLCGPKTIEVRLTQGGTRRLEGERIFLNLGTHAAIPNIRGLSGAASMTHVEALELDRLPAHLIVLGGGYVGLEMAQALRRLGSRVTVIEQAPQLAPREDQDVAEAIRAIFADDGIDVILEAAIDAIEGRSGHQVGVRLRTPAGERELHGSDLLVAAGRTPNTRGIGLESAGVELDPRGYIKVN